MRSKPTTSHRIYAQHGEKIGGHTQARYSLRLFPAGQIEIRVGKRGDVDRLSAVSEVNEVTERSWRFGEALLDVPFPDHDQLIRVRVFQWTQQHKVDDAEDGRVRSDSQRQRQYGHQGNGWTLQQHPRAVAHVLPNEFH